MRLDIYLVGYGREEGEGEKKRERDREIEREREKQTGGRGEVGRMEQSRSCLLGE